MKPVLLRGIVAEALSALAEAQVEEPHELSPPAVPQYDVIVISLPDNDANGEGWRMLSQHPTARIIALKGDASHASVYEMRPQCYSLGELSPQTLREAIVGRPAAPGTC